MIKRRSLIKTIMLSPLLFGTNLFSEAKSEKKDTFRISMFGDLDDDLIVLKYSLIAFAIQRIDNWLDTVTDSAIL